MPLDGHVRANEKRRASAEEMLGSSNLGPDAFTKGEDDRFSQGSSKNDTPIPSPAMTRSCLIEDEREVRRATTFRQGIKPNTFDNGKEVWLNSMGVRDEDADPIVAIIEAGVVTKLQIANNKIGDEGAKKIADCLEGNRTLTSLSLHGNDIGPEGGMAFARAIAKNGADLPLPLRQPDGRDDEQRAERGQQLPDAADARPLRPRARRERAAHGRPAEAGPVAHIAAQGGMRQ